MRRIMFYSYKGGAGRTLAAANVAAALAKLGKRVAIIDLDFEAPGLQHVFGVESLPQFRRGVGIQHYLRAERSLQDLVKEVTIDLFGEGAPLAKMYALPDNACLHFIMASPKFTQVDAQDPQVDVRMHKLSDYLRDELRLDFLIIDSASGIRDAYAIAAEITDEMFIFFRWSRQHVEGALRVIGYMKKLKDWQPSNARSFYLVACASPAEEEIHSLPDETLRDILLALRRQTQERLESTLVEAGAALPTIFHDIPEMIELKWRETVTGVFKPQTTSPYLALAEKIVNMPRAVSTGASQ